MWKTRLTLIVPPATTATAIIDMLQKTILLTTGTTVIIRTNMPMLSRKAMLKIRLWKIPAEVAQVIATAIMITNMLHV